jgi:hypothetical protein
MPPGVKRLAIAMQLDAHAIGEFDPVGKAMARHRDHDRDIGAERAFDQIAKTLALALLAPEAVDDQQVGALIDRAGDLLAGVEQLADIEPASRRAGAEALE